MIEHCWPFPEYDAILRDFPDLKIEPQCYARAKTVYADIVRQEAQAIQGLLLANNQLVEQEFYSRLIRQAVEMAECQPADRGLLKKISAPLVVQILKGLRLSE